MYKISSLMFHVEQTSHQYLLFVQEQTPSNKMHPKGFTSPRRAFYKFAGRFANPQIAEDTARFFGYTVFQIRNISSGKTLQFGLQAQLNFI